MGPGGKRWPEAGRALWVSSPPGWNEGRWRLAYLGCGKLKGSHLSSPDPLPFPALLGERWHCRKKALWEIFKPVFRGEQSGVRDADIPWPHSQASILSLWTSNCLQALVFSHCVRELVGNGLLVVHRGRAVACILGTALQDRVGRP